MPSWIDPNNFDTSIKPGDDFFTYANGGWLAKNPIPADESRWGTWDILRLRIEEQLKEILETTTDQRVRDFYTTAMDVAKRNAQGLQPLAGLFARIDAIKDVGELAEVIG